MTTTDDRRHIHPNTVYETITQLVNSRSADALRDVASAYRKLADSHGLPISDAVYYQQIANALELLAKASDYATERYT